LLTCVLALAGCEADIVFESEPSIVVEGWIEEGRAPVIILSSTVTLSQEGRDIESLRDNIIKWAKVTVSDGEHEEIMLSKVNRKYYPPYIYTTGMMHGEAGKQYTLTVEYKGKTLTSVTTIPPRVDIDTAYAVPAGAEGDYLIKLRFSDSTDTHDYYKVFSSTDSTSNMYYTTALQTINDADMTSGVISWDVLRGRFIEDDYQMYFQSGEQVMLKLCHIDSVSYQFWYSYENCLSFAKNALLQYSQNIRSNINGGMGYWCGYGASYYKVSVK